MWCEIYFDILNRLGGRTDGRTDGQIEQSCNSALYSETRAKKFKLLSYVPGSELETVNAGQTITTSTRLRPCMPRCTQMFHPPLNRTEMGYAFASKAPTPSLLGLPQVKWMISNETWNSLSPVVTSASSLPSFKRQLKTFLFQNSFSLSFSFIFIVYRVPGAFSLNATLIFTFNNNNNETLTVRPKRYTALAASQKHKYRRTYLYFTTRTLCVRSRLYSIDFVKVRPWTSGSVKRAD